MFDGEKKKRSRHRLKTAPPPPCESKPSESNKKRQERNKMKQICVANVRGTRTQRPACPTLSLKINWGRGGRTGEMKHTGNNKTQSCFVATRKTSLITDCSFFVLFRLVFAACHVVMDNKSQEQEQQPGTRLRVFATVFIYICTGIWPRQIMVFTISHLV